MRRRHIVRVSERLQVWKPADRADLEVCATVVVPSCARRIRKHGFFRFFASLRLWNFASILRRLDQDRGGMEIGCHLALPFDVAKDPLNLLGQEPQRL